jgi:hypothetical protein
MPIYIPSVNPVLLLGDGDGDGDFLRLKMSPPVNKKNWDTNREWDFPRLKMSSPVKKLAYQPRMGFSATKDVISGEKNWDTNQNGRFATTKDVISGEKIGIPLKIEVFRD